MSDRMTAILLTARAPTHQLLSARRFLRAALPAARSLRPSILHLTLALAAVMPAESVIHHSLVLLTPRPVYGAYSGP
ncbi:hypothetical protein OH76DRAFT_156280 [Lentinus brumalis]|uniref:Uncharacterized protein n=1 Tax=Lentinus brumalis TaxID=2498619 RepID=A0A371DIQ0_9APHY|nr:hypothetical protein OH76DRAFT_156280 [Polyporus brumalis]